MPDIVEYALIDIKDFVFFDYSSQNRGLLFSEIFKNSDNNIRKFLQEKNFEIVDYVGDFVLFTKNKNQNKNNLLKQNFNTQSQGIKFINVNLIKDKNGSVVNEKINQQNNFIQDNKIQILNSEFVNIYKFGYQAFDVNYLVLQKSNKNLYLQVESQNKKFLYPAGLGFLPTDEWQNGEIITVRYWVPTDFIQKEYTIKLVESFGNAYYNFLGSVVAQEL